MAGVRINHSVTTQVKTVSADGVEQFDLAVNPLSVVLLVIRPLTTATLPDYWKLVGALNRIAILYRGETVFSMSGLDCAMLNALRYGCNPYFAAVNTENDRVAAVLPVFLGRFPYDKRSCFPASRRGELVMELDIDVASTEYDNFQYSVETVEILGANPTEFERKLTSSATFAGTGDNDVDLPVGNVCRGALLFGTTGYVGEAAPAPSWGRMSVLLDNQQHTVSSTDFEVAQAMPSLLSRREASLAAPASGAVSRYGGADNYAFVDFDPTRDDEFSINTQGHSRFVIRANAETADAVRAVTVEKVSAGKAK